MGSIYNFKRIAVVPSATELTDIVLSKTQRKTPTVVHPGYNISRIRNFYSRKVKFSQDAFDEKLRGLLDEFPKLDDIHPFYADLINVLYDRDHYKLALGQVNTARHLIEQIAKDYVRLLKFGDSLYRCKQLKRAALGRMATLVKGLKNSLIYLEQVRQHLARLPSIDPATRTLLLTGYPNVGKSSFMNKVTRAQVDVQPYAFTTKSLFVGHMDYKYLRWQIIDTPGILDHPLEDRNTIEMQSITAMAHLRAAVLFFMDLSEQCGFSLEAQASLFHSIQPLFANKAVILVVNKIDAKRPEDLDEDKAKIYQSVVDCVSTVVLTSCHTEEGVMEARNICAEKLLEQRVEGKLRSNKVAGVANRLHLSVPTSRDAKERPVCIPAAVLEKRQAAAAAADAMDVDEDTIDEEAPFLIDTAGQSTQKRTMKDLEQANGGAGVFNLDLNTKDEWKDDKIPEIMDGRNIADFFDAEIEERLNALEKEEERKENEGFYTLTDEELEEEEVEMAKLAKAVRDKKLLMIQRHRLEKGKNRATVTKQRTAEGKLALEEKMASAGVDTVPMRKKRTRDEREEVLDMARQGAAPEQDGEVLDAGIVDVAMAQKGKKMARKSQTKRNLHARAGEGDRHIREKKPKHLFVGKRGAGKTERR